MSKLMRSWMQCWLAYKKNHQNWYSKVMDRLLPTLIKIVFIRTGHFTCGLRVKWFHTSLHQLMQTRQVMVCPTSGQWYPFQHTFGHCFCKVIYVCGASNSTWSDMFIESTSTPKAISSGMALVPVTISLLLQRCPRTSGGNLSHNIDIQQLTARFCQWQ